jgi:hypothetical protein
MNTQVRTVAKAAASGVQGEGRQVIVSMMHLAPALGLLSAWLMLPGCGSDSETTTKDAGIDAAKDVPVTTDTNNTGLDTSAPDQAVQIDAPSVDATQIDSSSVDLALDLGVTVDAGAAVDSGSSIDGGALPACSSLVNPLYIMSGDTQVPVLKTLGKALRQSANPVTLVWYATGSCTIIDALYNGTPLKQVPSYIPDDATWDPSTGAVPTCALESAGHSVDIGIPIVFPDACTTATPPADLVAFKGPVQSMLFVTPHSASPEAISLAQAKLVFGTGGAANVSPWTDDNFIFIRTSTKGVQVSLGALIGVPAAQWHGQQISASNDLATKVASSTSPEKTIGILGSETFDSATNRANLKALAFQTTGQSNGFLPDSTATAFDKRSVREGHYVAWAHVFYLTKSATVDGGTAQPVNANAKLLIDILTNTENSGIPSSLDTVALVANKGLVPLCAMTVTRSTEGGSLSPYTPSEPCGCYYESTIGTVPASCVACTAGTGTCAAGTSCHHGFCEADDGRTSLSDCSALLSNATHTQLINNTCTTGARFESNPIQ